MNYSNQFQYFMRIDQYLHRNYPGNIEFLFNVHQNSKVCMSGLLYGKTFEDMKRLYRKSLKENQTLTTHHEKGETNIIELTGEIGF